MNLVSSQPPLTASMADDSPSVECSPRVQFFDRNVRGRDFVVGDVHGMFTSLRTLMDEAGFDPETDRLFSVGDLVDRGPESRAAIDWLRQPWFFACRGNHEQFVLDSGNPEQVELWVNHNGGEWWLEVEPEERDRIVAAIATMPLAMEVVTEGGTVGIVHADVPPLMSWDAFMTRLESSDPDAMFYAMWSRNRIAGVVSSMPVQGRVSRVYCGHTPTRSTVTVDNVNYIDTGAVYCSEGYLEARLTLVEIHPERHREFALYTASR